MENSNCLVLKMVRSDDRSRLLYDDKSLGRSRASFLPRETLHAMAGKSESHGELVKSEISVMPFEQTTLVAGSQMRNMATMLDMEREINSQREQLIRVTYTMDRQVARLSREIELLQERQASNPEANWRVREDIEALSRRLDALEAFCRSEAEAKAEAKAEVDNGPQSASLQAQILAIREEIRALSAECHLEQTRDVAGVRARAAVEQMAAKQRAEMEKLHCQIADLQRSMSSQDNTPTSSQAESSQSMQHLLGSVEPVLRAALEQQLGRIVADLRGDTAARCAELRLATETWWLQGSLVQVFAQVWVVGYSSWVRGLFSVSIVGELS
eukprot:s5051_g10.t1